MSDLFGNHIVGFPTRRLNFACIITATPDPLCTSKNISVTASCNFDDGPCGFDIPMYPHIWELTRDDYGGDTTGAIKGDHTTGYNRDFVDFDMPSGKHVRVLYTPLNPSFI